MNLLFLRGQVPQDRDPRQIMFDDLESNDDMWTQLAAALCEDGYGEIWYWIGHGYYPSRYRDKTTLCDNFVERWVPDFAKSTVSFTPDVIFARGGFKQYDTILKRYPKAFKIYYGAGKRIYPKDMFNRYNLILNDTPRQVAKTRKTYPKIRTELFIKPAAENIFKPGTVPKKYNVIFVANNHPKGIKGHAFALPLLHNIKAVQVGISSEKHQRKFPTVHFTGWIPRKKVPRFYSQSKVAIICVDSTDSCPRVIPEALACNCPILLLDSVNCNRDLYISPKTGNVSTKSEFVSRLNYIIDNYDEFRPREYYESNLSIICSVESIRRWI